MRAKTSCVSWAMGACPRCRSGCGPRSLAKGGPCRGGALRSAGRPGRLQWPPSSARGGPARARPRTGGTSMRGNLSWLALALFPLLLAAPAGALDPRTHQVSPTGIALGDVAATPDAVLPRFSPDGEWLVWVQDATVNEGWNLWAARRWEGSAAVLLSDAYPANEGVVAFEIAPGSARVVYLAGAFGPSGPFQLWSVPIDGSAPPTALHAAPAGYGTADFALTPDGARAVFLADLPTAGQFALWSVPVAGPAGQADRLSPVPSQAGQDVEVFAISPTSGRVAFAGTLTADLFSKVWSAAIGGPAASTPISPLPSDPAQGAVITADLPLAFSNDGARVLFAGDFQTPGTVQLYSNTPTGSPSQADRLNSPPVSGGAVVAYALGPGTNRVVFRGDLLVDERFELWSAPVDGAVNATRLSTSTPSGFTDVTHVVIAPDAQPRVLFRADVLVDEAFDLFTVPVAGGTPTRLSVTGVGTRSLQPDFAVSADGARVVFRGNFTAAGKIELYSAATDGAQSSAVKLCPTPVLNGNVAAFAIDASSTRVVYAGDVLSDGRIELFGVPISGPSTSSARLHPAAGAGENVSAFALAPDGSRVAFLADLTTEGRDALWVTPVAGPETAAVQAHADAVANGAAVPPLAWSADARGVLFLGDLLVNEQFLLWDADEAIFRADHEEGDTSEWTSALP
ncbi:MAG: hypothetical protein F9K18_08080 [Thermoanaerobaculia bacterium]|nr:MAG: hypothetical protein F9K18_08080 [Thermoanaerobaculia bacterium]